MHTTVEQLFVALGVVTVFSATVAIPIRRLLTFDRRAGFGWGLVSLFEGGLAWSLFGQSPAVTAFGLFVCGGRRRGAGGAQRGPGAQSRVVLVCPDAAVWCPSGLLCGVRGRGRTWADCGRRMAAERRGGRAALMSCARRAGHNIGCG